MFRILGSVSLAAVALGAWGLALPMVSANTPPDVPGKRYALVVGNSAYSSVPALKNAGNDANDVADMLRGLNIEVISLIDATREEMEAAVADLSARAPSSEATLFYYSGHGFQLDGRNYLVPVDATLKNRDQIDDQTLQLDEIIAKLSGNTHQTLILLDACRNNPLPESMQSEGADGLAKVETGAGTFVAFATQPGAVAFDGSGENSPFTHALIENLDEPGISISDLMIKVRVEVEEETFERQLPWDQSSLRSQFYFVPEIERNAEFTPQDLQLLASLSPELRAQFEEVFELQITPPDAIQVADVSPDATEAVIREMRNAVPLGALIPHDEYAKAIELAALNPVATELTAPVPQMRTPQIPQSDAVPADVTVAALVPQESTTASNLGAAPTLGPDALPANATPVVTSTNIIAVELPDEPDPRAETSVATTIDVVPPSGNETIPLPRDLAMLVQTELSRLGCYRSAVDGDWGRQSKRALLRYYATRQIAPNGSEPSTGILNQLQAEATVVCTQTAPRDTTVKTATVVAAPAAATTTTTRTTRGKPRFETQPGHITTPSGNVVPDQKAPIKISPGISMF